MRRPYRCIPITVLVAICCGLALGASAFADVVKRMPDGTCCVTLSIPEMECSVCCSNVRAELGKVKGVREVRLDVALRRATVRFEPARTSVKALQAALARLNMDSAPVDEPTRP